MASAANTKTNGDHRNNQNGHYDLQKEEQNAKSSKSKAATNGKVNRKKGTLKKQKMSEHGSGDEVLSDDQNVTFASKRERHPKKRRRKGTDGDGDGKETGDMNESSNSSTDNDSDSGSSSGSTGSDSSNDSSSDSGDDDSSSDSWGEDEDDIQDPREDAYAEQRQLRTFRNINEFQLEDVEKKGFLESQKLHNNLLGNVQEIKDDIGYDWFDDKLIKTWKDSSKRKKKS